jgi:CRISPR-associated protein Csx10
MRLFGISWQKERAEVKRIQLEIKALSPLAISRQKPGGSVSEAENYIPGSVLRGAIAGQILQQANSRNQNLAQNGGDFQSLFLGESPAIFQNAYPATIETPKQTVVQHEIMVLPATALSSKTKSGFKTERNNGVFDTLIDRFCAEGYGHFYDPNCPIDGGRVDSVSSVNFYSKLDGKYYSHAVNKRLLTQVGINRRRATAEEQILYSIEVLNESQGKKQKPVIYTGAILVPEALANSLQQFIDQSEVFRLGGATSRGLGRVKIKAESPVNAETHLEKRIGKFTKELQERWHKWKIFGSPKEEIPPNRFYFTLDLQSDAILTEQWRRTTVVSEAMLQQFTGIEDSSLKLHVAYSSYDYRSGWNAAWGLMKDVELITNKGGVYLFSTTQLDFWLKALETLQIQGVGKRTSEGFGQVQICNEFHLVFRENPV